MNNIVLKDGADEERCQRSEAMQHMLPGPNCLHTGMRSANWAPTRYKFVSVIVVFAEVISI